MSYPFDYAWIILYCCKFLHLQENTFQAILITDGVYTYTIFVYKCGLLEWDNGVTIGFNAASGSYDNYDPSSSNISCLNIVNSNFTNVVYRLSDANPEYPLPRENMFPSLLQIIGITSFSLFFRGC